MTPEAGEQPLLGGWYSVRKSLVIADRLLVSRCGAVFCPLWGGL